jgi:uncharacterized membrane protein
MGRGERARRKKQRELIAIQQAKAAPRPPTPQIVQTAMVSFSGPLPHPEMLQRYNEIVPNGAERIMAQFEQQSAHRRALETNVLSGNSLRSWVGMIMAYTIAMTAIVGGFVLIYFDKTFPGIGTILTAVAGLAAVFVYGRREEREQLRQSRDDLRGRR